MKTDKFFLCRIGADKLQIVQAKWGSQGRVQVESFYEKESRALRGGMVSDLGMAGEEVEDLFRAVDMSLESFMAPLYVILDESRLNLYPHQSALSISRSGKLIDNSDIRRAINLARKTALIPLEQAILYVVPREYRVDNMEGILNPIGLEGRRLGVKLFLYALDHSMYSNIQKVFYRSGIADIQFLPECWMVAQGILREDELRGKTLLVDLEDSHAAILLVHRFAPVYNKIAPYGADRALSGLADDLKLDFSELRRLKKCFGSLAGQDGIGGGRIPLPGDKTGGAKTIEAEDFQKRIYDSSVTLLQKLGSEIAKVRVYNPDLSSVVVTGPGFAMDGLSELAQDIWSIRDPLRFGLPYGVEGEKSIVTNPANIALMGALRWVAAEKTKQHLEIEEQGLIQRQLERLRGWFRRHF